MTPDSVGPLSRPFPLHRITPAGVAAEVEATPEERAALAVDLGLPGVSRLEGRFRLVGLADRIRVTGRVSARVEQICTVTLDPFEADIGEDVEVEFQAASPRRSGAAVIDIDPDRDLPEELVGDRIDLGAITAEFLALGLDPYPRKPGVAFEAAEDERGAESPFGGLAHLRVDPTKE